MEETFKLLTVSDLAKRWQKDETTIRKYVREGTLTPCKDVPGMLFHPQYISKLEGVELERFSPLEKKRLINKIEQLEHENEKYKKIIAEAQILLTKAVFNIEDRKDW